MPARGPVLSIMDANSASMTISASVADSEDSASFSARLASVSSSMARHRLADASARPASRVSASRMYASNSRGSISVVVLSGRFWTLRPENACHGVFGYTFWLVEHGRIGFCGRAGQHSDHPVDLVHRHGVERSNVGV